jgi:hypothetical protein
MSGFNCLRLSCSSLVMHWSNCNKLDSFSWAWETADSSFRFSESTDSLCWFYGMPGLAEGLLPFRKAVMNTWEFSVAFVLFSRNFLKWARLGHFWWREVVRGKWKKNQNLEMVDVTLVLTAPSLFTNWMCRFSSLPFSTVQCKFELVWIDSVVSVLYFICWSSSIICFHCYIHI